MLPKSIRRRAPLIPCAAPGDAGSGSGAASDKPQREFLVQGPPVTTPDFLAVVNEAGTIELLQQISKDLVVLRMTDADCERISTEFRNLVIEPNAPLKRL